MIVRLTAGLVALGLLTAPSLAASPSPQQQAAR